VDLYGGSTAETPEGARELMQMAMKDQPQLLANLRAADTFLREEAGAPRVGVMGWCLGGGMALNAALDQPQSLDALVMYYGRIRDAEQTELAALQMPVMGHFGAEDESIPLENVRSFERTLDDLGKTAQIYTYPDAGHAFANPSGQNYNPEAAAQAWDRTTRFLRQHLYSDSEAPPASAN
jgi:carboxymethylenebutenolidase